MRVNIETDKDERQTFSFGELFSGQTTTSTIYRIVNSGNSDARFISVVNAKGELVILVVTSNCMTTVVEDKPGTLTYDRYSKYMYVECDKTEKLVFRNT